MFNKVHFSSKDMKYETPQEFFDGLNEEFNFTLDPCCVPQTAKCDKYFTPEDDGLKKSWGDNIVFMNPPYGREIKKWVKKAKEEAERERVQ
jgi:site-specific DNA-methyltransferase (adenine-specific)